MMSGVFAPSFLVNRTWPDSVRKEFSGQLHKFMASLTEGAHAMKGACCSRSSSPLASPLRCCCGSVARRYVQATRCCTCPRR